MSFDVAHEFAEALAERMGDELVQVALFGSRARGDARWRSDYDLVVVLRTAAGESRDAVHRLATRLELDHNVDLSIKLLDRERFEQLPRSSPRFWRNYARDEKVLWPPTSLRSAQAQGFATGDQLSGSLPSAHGVAAAGTIPSPPG
jgi:uncharacterized protein